MPEKNKSSTTENTSAELMDLIPYPVVILDASGKSIAVNRSFGKYAGLRPEEVLGKKMVEFELHGKGKSLHSLENFENISKSRAIFPCSARIKLKNGAYKLLKVESKKICYKGKKCYLLIFNHSNDKSNNQKRASLDLIDNEVNFKHITNSIEDTVVTVDNNAKIIYWNSAAEKTFGYTSEEATGRHIHELVVPNSLCKEAKERIETSVEIFGQTGIGYFTVGAVEVVARRRDGTEFPVELSISPIKLEDEWSAVAVVRDITEKKKEEQKVREAEQRYHALFNQAPLGILIIDPQSSSFVEFNDLAPFQLEYTHEEFEKLSLVDIVAESPEKIQAQIKGILKSGSGEFESKLVTKNGNIRNALTNAITLQLQGKTLIHYAFQDITEMRQMQNALMESESRYRQLVELAQEGIWAIDNNNNIVFVNPRMAQLLGYATSELLGKNLADILGKKATHTKTGRLEEFNKPGAEGQYEYAFPRKNGTFVNTRVVVSTITDDQGQVIGKLALVADETDRKKLEDELRSSEERFRAITISAMDSIILVDSSGSVIYWNPASEKTFGYSEKEVLGKKITEYIVLKNARKKHLSKQTLAEKHLEFMAIKKGGIQFPIELSVTSCKLHDANCMLVVVRDISERKAMENALKQEKEMLENVAKSVDAGLALINKDYKILWANQLLKKADGQDIEQTPCYKSFGKVDKVCPDCGVTKIFEKGLSVDRHDYRFMDKGQETWVELIVTPVKDANGQVVAALELAVNITERKKLQNKLAEYSQRLEQLVQQRTEQLRRTQVELVKSERLAAIGELAGMIGHDLRNPLTGIKNSAYYLRKKGHRISEEQEKEMLDIIDKCVDYSNKIINDLLDYSRELRLNLSNCSPKVLVLECLEMVQVPENVKIINNLSPNQSLKADPDKIKRVFGNLIKNAIDAMPNGGQLTIDGKISGNKFAISFEDTGLGISADILPKLFSPLFTTKAKGMGFGLAICKRIVESHCGEITVKSIVGQGTTFTVYIPVEQTPIVGGERIWVNTPESSLSMTTKT